jgi:hypothetical protein
VWLLLCKPKALSSNLSATRDREKERSITDGEISTYHYQDLLMKETQGIWR